jgi:hypothetical protein
VHRAASRCGWGALSTPGLTVWSLMSPVPASSCLQVLDHQCGIIPFVTQRLVSLARTHDSDKGSFSYVLGTVL